MQDLKKVCLLFILPVWLWPNLVISMLPHSCARDALISKEPTSRQSFGVNYSKNKIHTGTSATIYIYLQRVIHEKTNSITKIKTQFKKLKPFSSHTHEDLMQPLIALTYWCVKSNMLLVWVEVLVLLPTELANIAPSFCRQKHTFKPLYSSESSCHWQYLYHTT